MTDRLILASQSETRLNMLKSAGVEFRSEAARVDEAAIVEALIAEKMHPRDIADALANAKAAKVASRHEEALVLGCDQVLSCQGKVFSKAENRTEATQQLRDLRNNAHDLYSAAVLYDQAKPVWRHVGRARLTMRHLSDAYIDDYVDRNWDSVKFCVGCYKLEEKGARLFSRVEGDHFTILGLPLIEFLSYLTLRGSLPT